MWEYNYYDPNVLCHYGVPGMKWGRRKANPAVASARQNYKSAKKDLRTAAKEQRRVGYTAIGIKGLEKYNKAEAKTQKADLKTMNAKAQYKAAKSKNAQKAELKTYTREMYKSGLPGSAADRMQGGRSTRIYNDLKAKKGKAYADKVAKKVQNQSVAGLATAATVAVGSAFISAYLEMR